MVNIESGILSAIIQRCSEILELMGSGEISDNEPITIFGHSHGGNVGIEAINQMVNMPEFEERDINLLTINTPVRDDYQLEYKE